MTDRALSLTLNFAPNGNDAATIFWLSEVLDGAVSTFVSPYPAADLPAVIKALDMLQKPQPLSTAEAAVLERYSLFENGAVRRDAPVIVGETLYQALGTRGMELIERVQGHARNSGQRLNYILRFTRDCARLAALPWELLRRPNHDYLLLRADDSCERSVVFGEPPSPPLANGQLPHVLVLLPHFSVDEAERSARIELFAALQRRGALTFDVLSPLTTTAFAKYMLRLPKQPHIIHYAGHGAYRDQKGWLLFDEENGKRLVNAEQFSATIAQSKSVSLAVFEACHSAMVAEGELLTGIAPALSYTIDAVVAMQLTVRSASARRFIEVFYDQLLVRAQPLRVAVAQARRALFLDQDQISWYVPVLYMRVPPRFTPATAAVEAGTRRIVAQPVRRVVLLPVPAGKLEVLLAQDQKSGHWQLQVRSREGEELELITVSVTHLPPNIQFHPPVVRIPRVLAGQISPPEYVDLSTGAGSEGARMVFEVTYRVARTGRMERHRGVGFIQYANPE